MRGGRRDARHVCYDDGGGCFFAMMRIRVQAIRCDDSGDGRGVAAIGPGGEKGENVEITNDDILASDDGLTFPKNTLASSLDEVNAKWQNTFRILRNA